MNEEPKSIWKKSWRGPMAFLLVAVVAFAEVVGIGLVIGLKSEVRMLLIVAATFTGLALFLVLAFLFVRWLFKPGNLKRVFFAVVLFATLIALFYAEEDWRGWHAWNQFKKEWEAKGEKFDRQSVVPPPVPDDQNFAMTPLVTTSYGACMTRDGKYIPYDKQDKNYVNRLNLDCYFGGDSKMDPTHGLGNRQKATETDLKVWQDFYRSIANPTNGITLPPEPQSPASDVLLALNKYNPTIEELRRDASLPYARFPLEYDKDEPASILLPHLATLKKCSQVLQLRAIAELQNNQSEKALADVKLILRLADSLRTEPILISHLVRIAMLQAALQPVYEGLAAHRWSDVQLAELDAVLATEDFVADYQFAMRSEMALFQCGSIDYLRRCPQKLANLTDLEDSEASSWAILLRLLPAGWFYQNELFCARWMVTGFIPAADAKTRVISAAVVKATNESLTAELKLKHTTPYNFIGRLLLPGLMHAAQKFAYAQASVDLARTAIALERYRLAHGDFPESPDSLEPQFVAQLPHDVISGKPLHYRRTENGQFILYSIGWNETDDDGKVVLNTNSTSKSVSVNLNEGDWVWRYPQK